MKTSLALTKKILLLAIPCVIFITSLILYIQSIEKYDGGFDANFDYVIVMGAALIWGAYELISILKPAADLVNAKIVVLLTDGALLGFYSLGMFFKGVVKHKEFTSIQTLLYAGIIGVLVCAYGVISYFEENKK